MKASLSNFRQSPRKTRLVADMLRGKSIVEAKRALAFLPKKAAPAIEKLLDSAVSNARGMGASVEDLIVKTISVDKALVIRRFKPMARGRAAGIRRTRSHIKLELASVGGAPKAAKKAAKKKATKEN